MLSVNTLMEKIGLWIETNAGSIIYSICLNVDGRLENLRRVLIDKYFISNALIQCSTWSIKTYSVALGQSKHTV